jgi:hypothetical protein
VFGDQPVPPWLDVSPDMLRIYAIKHAGSTPAIFGNTLIESEGYASQAYGIRGSALILIRPDGYIGLTGGRGDFQVIENYLRDMIGQMD